MSNSNNFRLKHIFKAWPIAPFPMVAVISLFEIMVNLAVLSAPVLENWRWVKLPQFGATVPSVIFGAVFGFPLLWFFQQLSKKYSRLSPVFYWLSGGALGVLMGFARFATINELTPSVWNYPNSWVRIFIATFVLFVIVHVTIGFSGEKLAEQVKVAESAKKSLEVQRNKLISAQEDVRREIADFLHDHLQSDLVLLGMQMQRSIENMDPETKSIAQAYIDEIERIRQFEVRSVSKQLAPELVSPLLRPALEDLVSRYAKAISIELDVSEQGKLSKTLRLACFRIVEQGLLNAATHAQATEIHIEVYEKSKSLEIKVSNNGQALPDNPVPGAGFATIDVWASQFDGEWALSSNNGITELSVLLKF